MKKALNKKVIIVILLVTILLIQSISVLYATSKREYYHIDEYYSHGLMQYKNAFIFENEDFLNKWHTKDYFEDYLTINPENKWNFSAVYQNQINDVHPPVYYLLLRIACSFNLGEFSIWPGTILNLIIFIFSSILLFKIGKKIFKSDAYALLLCFINGFSLASIETVMYVRMYQLLVFNILLVVYWHISNREKEKLIWKDLLPLYFMIIIGFLTHYYYAIIVCMLYFMYIIKYCKNKNKENAISYTFTIIWSVTTSLIIFPFAILHIFFGYRGVEVIENATSFSYIYQRIIGNIMVINKELFNNHINIILVILIIVGGIALWKNIKKKNLSEAKPKEKNLICYVTLPMLIFLLFIVIASPYIDLRYIMPIVPLIFCTILYLYKEYFEQIISPKKAFCSITILAIIFSATTIPKLENNLYTYKNYGKAVKYIEENLMDKPWIYSYVELPVSKNKIMQCYGVLIKVKETYVMQYEEMSSQKIIRALQEKDLSKGMVLLVDYTRENETIEKVMQTKLFNSCEWKSTLGIYKIYLFQ